MVTFTPDGSKVLVANEGEPNGDYSVDPDGSVSVIDLSNGAANLTASDVTEVKFGSAAQLGPVRISAKSGNDVDADVEPEYIVVSGDSSTAFVFMQENNTVGIVDLTSNTATTLLGLGFKDYSIPGNEFDASNRDNGINIRNWPVFGVYMPDGADSYEFNGTTYLVTANEGDGREYLTDADSASDCRTQGGFDFDDGDCFHYLDEIRVKDIDESRISAELATRAGFASVADMQKNENLGRLKVITDLGLSGTCATIAMTGQPDPADANCTYEALYSYGARSFTIWNTATGQAVFDSGNAFEVITAQRLGNDFNATNDENGGDDRSDDKGPEPEAVEIGVINGKTYAFIALERVGGIMVYDISNPETASFVQYINTRDFSSSDLEADLASSPSDLGPEAIKFVSASDSPIDSPLLIVGNEVSGTTAFFKISVMQ